MQLGEAWVIFVFYYLNVGCKQDVTINNDHNFMYLPGSCQSFRQWCHVEAKPDPFLLPLREKYFLITEWFLEPSLVRNRPYSRYTPSLHALKDWWDNNNVTWFLKGKTSDKATNARDRGRVCFFYISDNEEGR